MQRLLVALFLLTGCTERPPPPPAEISFKRDIEPVFVQHCAAAEGCHGVKPTDHVDLTLTKNRAYDELVNMAAENRAGAMRVDPGNLANSFLVAKLAGNLGNKEGKPMPLDPETGATPDVSPLPNRFLKDVLEPWIRAGAKNN